MAHAISTPIHDAVLQSHPHMVLRVGPYTYTVDTHGSVSTFTVSDGVSTLSLPILWGFGTGAQTWMVERAGHYHETLITYYPELGGLGVTTGDGKTNPQNIEEAIGPEESDSDSRVCFGCHTTGGVKGNHLALDSMKPGVTCEHCHAGALDHMADASLGRFNSIPPSLGAKSPEEMSKFCGECHRTWETVIRHQWRGTVTVRFQPFRLANSKCFSGTDPRISCVACHDPHKDLVHDAAFYDAKCLACHAPALHVAALNTADKPGSRVAAVCPVATSKCISCHMPKVKLPDAPTMFTDHQIRVVRAGEAYPD